MTDDEKKALFAIFPDSVDYESVRIVEGRVGILGLTNSVFTVQYKIRFPSSSPFLPVAKHRHCPRSRNDPCLAVREWGPDYVPEALVAQQEGQVGIWLDDSGKEVPAPAGYAFDVAVAAGMHWPDFNPEQQATFIEVAYQRSVDFDNPTRLPMMLNGVDYRNELADALEWIGSGEGTA